MLQCLCNYVKSHICTSLKQGAQKYPSIDYASILQYCSTVIKWLLSRDFCTVTEYNCNSHYFICALCMHVLVSMLTNKSGDLSLIYCLNSCMCIPAERGPGQ